MVTSDTPQCNFDQCSNSECWIDGDKSSADYGKTLYECYCPGGKMDADNCPCFTQKCPLCEGTGCMPDAPADGELTCVIVIRGTGNSCSVDFTTYPDINDVPEAYKDTAVLRVSAACLQACQNEAGKGGYHE